MKVPRRTDIDVEWLREQKKLGRSDKEIAKELGISSPVIGQMRAKHNIQNSVKSPLNNRKRVIIDPTWLVEQKKKGRSDKEIATELSCCTRTVFLKRKQFGIGQTYHKTRVDVTRQQYDDAHQPP